MKTASIQVPTSIDQTLPANSDPLFQSAQLSLILSNTLKELDTQGFEFTSPESSDFSTYGNDLKTFAANMSTREDEILTSGVSSVVATLPDVVPLIGAILSGGAAAIPSILLNAVVSQMFKSRDTSIDVKGGEILPDDVDFTSLIAKLTELVEAVEDTLNTFTINILRDKEAQSWSVGPTPDE